MVIREVLENESSVDLNDYIIFRMKKTQVVHQQEKRKPGDSTIPTPRTNTAIKNRIQKEINNGDKYNKYGLKISFKIQSAFSDIAFSISDIGISISAIGFITRF